MRKANFFILGAAKAGTTSLANYLDEHLEIYISKPKEPNFFATDLSEKYPRIKSRSEYDELFEKAPLESKILGEASTMHLASSDALNAILEYNASSKFLIILRNPIKMAESWHSHKLYYLEEEVDDFEKAWDLQDVRKQGMQIPKKCLDATHLQYLDFCSVGSQLEKVINKIDKDKLLIVFLEDLKQNPNGTYQQVLQFLNVSKSQKKDFETYNERKSTSSKWIQRFVMSFSFDTIKKIKSLKKKLGLEGVSIVRFIEKKNRMKPIKKPLSDSFKRTLVSAFENEIKKLEKITDRDLTKWRQV